MPCSRQSALTGAPASACFNIASIWLSLYLDFFMQNLLHIVYEKILLMNSVIIRGDYPAIVDTRGRLGDWEGDTVIGKRHQGALVTLVERKSLYTVMQAVAHKTANAVHCAVTELLTPFA